MTSIPQGDRMATPSRSSLRVRFGEFELDLTTRELWINGTKQTLAPQPFQVLRLLLERRGQLVTRDDLVRHLWPSDTFVDYEQGLRKAINRLREALNDSTEEPRFIETLPRQGYRFIGELEFEATDHGHASKPIVLHPHLVETEPKPQEVGRRFPGKRVWWAVAGIGLCAALLLWRGRRLLPQAFLPRELKVTQVTANSFENPVTSSAISPDGKFLAFTDLSMRIRIRLLDTGETRTIPESESLNGSPVDWTVAAWLPDGTRFIANARPHGDTTFFPSRFKFVKNSSLASSKDARGVEPTSIWIVSILGGTPTKLRDGADAFSASPDGLWIAFGTNAGYLGDREIWIMDLKGQQARKLYDAPPDRAIGGLRWFPDGRRTIYFEAGTEEARLVSRDLKGGVPVPLVTYADWASLTDFIPLSDGRLIYAFAGNLWELKADTRTGTLVGQPRQLTKWSGLWVGEMTMMSKERRITFQRSMPQTTVNLADIEDNGLRLSSVRHFTLNEYYSAAETWTPDSKALIFRTVRNGHLKLFRQALDSDTEEPLVVGSENVAGSAISPDGTWLYYLNCRAPAGGLYECEGTVPVMAMPMSGGASHEVMKSWTYGRPRCAVSPGNVCVVAEQSADGKPLVFIGFDAVHGRGPELARFETEPGAEYFWGVSRDGTRVAILKYWDNQIHIVPLRGGVQQTVTVKGATRLIPVYWAADGAGWFTTSLGRAGAELLYVDARGEAHNLWQRNGDAKLYGMPSPDGRHLAIVATTNNNNVWMMENF